MKPLPTLHADLAGAIREVLDRAEQPLNLAKIRSQLNGPFKVPAKLKDALSELLESEARQGRIYSWPASSLKGGSRYWVRDSRAWAVPVMIEAAAREPVKASKVVGAVAKQYGRKPAEALVAELVESGELIRVPLFGAKARLTSQLLDEVAFRAELDAARKIIDAGYRRLGSPAGVPANDGDPQEEDPILDSKILDALASLEPQKGLLVTAPRIYRALAPGIGKSEIDAALVRLQEERQVILHRHSNAQSLNQDERQSLIEDGAGNYYVGACWRVEQD
jgi:hypothetical protein